MGVEQMKLDMPIHNENGMATLEVLPLILVFLMLFSYTLGAFGIIHTGIMQSISARAYTFETFRNRTNLVYFRDLPGRDRRHYRAHGNRFHSIMTEKYNSSQFRASERAIRMGIGVDPDTSRNDPTVHNEKIYASEQLKDKARNESVEVSPAWITVSYGICLRVSCGDSQ